MLPMQLLLAGALFLLGALTDTLQFAPALYTVEQTVSCVLLNIPFVPFAIDNVQSFLGQEQRATHQLRLTCNLLINSQTTNDLLRSLASISSEFKDTKFYDSQSAIDVSKGPSIDLTPSLSWGAMSPATPAQVPVTPIPAPIPAPTIPVIQQQEPISNQTGVIREVEFYHISFFITQRDCIVAAITATVVTLLHALAYLISAWIMQDNDTEEYDEDFVPEAAIMLVPWVDCLLNKYGYDSSVVEDEALTIIDNVEPSILVDPEHPSTYEEPVEQDNGVLDIEHPLDAGDSGLHNLNQDITATVPYSLDQASPANNATTTDKNQGASLSQPIHECVPETADYPVMETQEATTQVVDVLLENNTQPTEESTHVEFKETNHVETDLVQPQVEQDIISAAQSETVVPDLITEQPQTSGLPDIEAVPDQPAEIDVVDLSMYDDSTKKTLDIDVHQTESPVMATPKPTDHIDILKPEVSEFSEFSGGLNDSIHAPKAIKQAKALQGLVSNGTSVSSVRMNASAAPFIPNFTKTFVSESPKQESVPSRKHSQDLELSPPRKLESYSEPTFVSKGGLGDSMWAPKSGLTASHGIRTSKTVETPGLADSIWAPKIAETPGIADSVWAPKTVKADVRHRRNTIGDTARRPTVHEDVSTETTPMSDSESDEMEWQQASNAHYGNSKENIDVPSGNADASMGHDSGSDTTVVEYNGDYETVSLAEVPDTIQPDQTRIIKGIAEGVSSTQMERKQELDKEDEEEDKREQEQGPEIESPIASPTTSPRVLAMDRELEALQGRNRNYSGSGWSGSNNRGGRGRGQARGQARGQDQNRSQRQGGGSSRGRGRRGGNYSNNGQQGGNSFSNNGQRGGYSSSNNEQPSQEKAQSEWNNFRTYPRQVRGGA